MLALQIKGIETCIMAGDPQQLPPTVKSAAGLKAGLDCTLFTRLADLGELKTFGWVGS